jgi:hypothetical protein
MQGVLAATCTLFGVLWLRAVARVKRSIARRSAMVQRLAGASGSLSEETLQRVIDGVVRLQANVRRRQATVAMARMVAMDAYEASTPYRNRMLWLLNMVVGLYLASCLYIIALYGTSGQGAAVGRWGVLVTPFGLEGPAEWRLGGWVGGGVGGGRGGETGITGEGLGPRQRQPAGQHGYEGPMQGPAHREGHERASTCQHHHL